jgi:hypothetical protein
MKKSRLLILLAAVLAAAVSPVAHAKTWKLISGELGKTYKQQKLESTWPSYDECLIARKEFNSHSKSLLREAFCE